MNFSRLFAIIQKEFRQMRRDRFTFAMMLGIPLMQLLLFGYAINLDVRNIETVCYDLCQSPESRRLMDRFENTDNFKIVKYVDNYEDLEQSLDDGSAYVGIVIPRDFDRSIARGEAAAVQVIVDGTNPTIAGAAMNGAGSMGQYVGWKLKVEHLRRSGSPVQPEFPLDLRLRARYNPDMETAVYIVPGLIGVILTLTLVIITSMAIVREREQGTLEQLIATPIQRNELMLGKIIPYVLIGYVQITVALLFGYVLFDVPMRGNVLLLYALSLIFIICTLGLGMFISTLVKTQMQAIQMSFFVFLPSILLSGFMFPRESMPGFVQWVSLALPLTYFLPIIRGIILKGVGLAALWEWVVPLSVFTVVIIWFAILRFQKKLD